MPCLPTNVTAAHTSTPNPVPVTWVANNTNITFFPLVSAVPCAPQNVSASLVCLTHSVLVSWVGSPSALWYNVTLVGQDGHLHCCQTNSSTCEIPHIHCGESYSITVVPYSETCAGQQSDVYVFRTGTDRILGGILLYFIPKRNLNPELILPGLCAPHNVTVSPADQDNIVSWSQVAGAETFVAVATANDGHNHTCRSNSSNSCNLTDLHCGKNYTITVVTVDGGCWSEPRAAVVLKTGNRELETKRIPIFTLINNRKNVNFSNKSILLS